MITDVFIIAGADDAVPAELRMPVANDEFQTYVNYLRENDDELMTQQFKVFHNFLLFY